MTDPLALHDFTTRILGAITGMAPVAAAALIVILVLYGALRARG